MPNERVIYLHGFASSPQSRKAQFFADRLRGEGFRVDIPDLAGGDFEHLTVSGQLAVVARLLESGGPAILIGSSLGVYLAALSAARHPEQIERVVLLAPAFGFYQLWMRDLGQEKLESWRKTDRFRSFIMEKAERYLWRSI